MMLLTRTHCTLDQDVVQHDRQAGAVVDDVDVEDVEDEEAAAAWRRSRSLGAMQRWRLGGPLDKRTSSLKYCSRSRCLEALRSSVANSSTPKCTSCSGIKSPRRMRSATAPGPTLARLKTSVR